MKNLLKKIGPIYNMNARWKAAWMKRWYRKTRDYYENLAWKLGVSYHEESVTEKVAERLALRALRVRPVSRGNLRILYVGTDEHQDTGGFLQSLERFGRVYRFTQQDGTYGHYFTEQDKATEKRRDENGRRLLELVGLIREEGPLDIVLGQMQGRTMPRQALRTVQDMGIVTVNIWMDDRQSFRGGNHKGQWVGPAGLIGGVDLVLTTTPEACLWYAVEGCPAVFWPEASDPAIFHPMGGAKKFDVCFVGGRSGIRPKIVQAIRERGIHVECYGNGWPKGRIATEDVPALFTSSKIVLGVGTIGHCTDFYSLKMRDFDATLSGSMYLTHANPDLKMLFEVGKDIVCYKTPEECADRCEYYIANETEREAIARAGRERSLHDHTWEARFEKLFRLLGFLENGASKK